MRDLLAERLLARVMEWDAEDVARERPLLQAMASLKYDDYQQFSPGMRFIESLAVWLSQFQELEERRVAYDLFKQRVTFISSMELAQLAISAYPQVIRPRLIADAANDLGISKYRVAQVVRSEQFRIRRRQMLVLGLSDGARLDVFRRGNPEVSHEQVSQVYLLAPSKLADLRKELATDLHRLLGRTPVESLVRFRSLYLIDDFSASGTSYCRREETGFKGKVINALKQLADFDQLIDPADVDVNVLLYVATATAEQRIKDRLAEWTVDNYPNVKLSVHVLQTIADSERVPVEPESPLEDLLKKYFDPAIVDDHYKKGAHARPYLVSIRKPRNFRCTGIEQRRLRPLQTSEFTFSAA